MSTRINHNLLSMGAQRAVWTAQNDLDSAVQRLSSGLRINYAWDDPTGLGISERMRSQIAGMVEAEKNANYNINMMQTAEGALAVIRPDDPRPSGCERRIPATEERNGPHRPHCELQRLLSA
ncbi:MAG: hypothetical protein IPG71_08680 [bacterium]|nr:hypothetical protein [bacterium]